MENDKEKVSASNNKLNPAAARPQEERKANCKNADNHDLGPWEELPIGNVPEVNGLWAVEMHEFVPTCAELLAIAEHWARVANGHTSNGQTQPILTTGGESTLRGDEFIAFARS